MQLSAIPPFPLYGSFSLHGTGTGTRTETGTGNGKNGFLYIMQECSHCMGPGQGPESGLGPENLAMGSKPIFLVLVLVPPVPVLVPERISESLVW